MFFSKLSRFTISSLLHKLTFISLLIYLFSCYTDEQAPYYDKSQVENDKPILIWSYICTFDMAHVFLSIGSEFASESASLS